MKLQKLTIHNIASIENAVIDFEAQPLADSEVFLITGKTGAGKSTILDAICLALFADTPRMENVQMQGKTKDVDNLLELHDPRQLLRQNTGEGYVTLTFTGSNSIHYEACWKVWRAKKDPKGNLQGKYWELQNLDKGFVYSRDKEISQEIKSAIGLDFNQFCRTTMLAQGEFTKFLDSGDAEKAAILEKVTGMDIYAKIGKKIFDVTKDKKDSWDKANQRLEDIRTLSDDEVAAKTEKMTELNKQHTTIKETIDADNAKLLWITTDAKLRDAVLTATKDYEQAQSAVDSDEFKAKDLLVNQWNATIEARNWLAAKKSAENNKEQQQKNLSALASDYTAVLGGYAYAEQEKKQAEERIKELDAAIESEKDKKEVYEKAQTIVGYMNTIADGRKKIEESQTNIEKEKKNLTETLTPAFEKAHNAAKEAQESYEKQDKEIQSQEKALAKLNLSGLHKQRDNGKDLLQNIGTTLDRIESLAKERKKRQEASKTLEDAHAEIEKKKKELEQLKPQIHDAEVKMKDRREMLDKQKDTVDKFAKTLRQKLHKGDECPVCRQKITSELPHEEELAKLVGGLTDAFKEAEDAYKKLESEQNKLNAEITAKTDSYQTAKAAFDNDKSVADAEQKVADACKKCGIATYDDNTPAALEELKKTTETKLKELEAKIAEGEKQDKAIKEQRKKLDKFRVESLDVKVKKEQEAEKAINDCKGRIATQEEVVKTKKADVSNAENEATSLIFGQWPIDWREKPVEFAEQLKKQAESYQNNLKQQQTLANSLSGMTTGCQQVKEVIDEIGQLMPAWKDLTPTDMAKQPDLLRKANGMKTSTSTALTQLNQAEEAARENSQQLGIFFENHKDITPERLEVLNGYNAAQIGETTKQLKAAKNNELTKRTLKEEAIKKQEEHQKGKPELQESDTAETLAARIKEQEPKLLDIAKEIGAISKELETNAANKKSQGKLKDEVEKLKAEYQKWSSMNQFIGDSEGKKFRQIAQSYVLSSLIHSANSYMKTLTDRYTMKVEPGSFVIQVEDAYQGYATRAASTISGGESFLVSLSLALALSDIGQQLAVDTLFIDEGFGTLSGEPLQNAISTLRSLHTKSGRHVGIISHIEELRERIPVQIQVEQKGNTSSSQISIVG